MEEIENERRERERLAAEKAEKEILQRIEDERIERERLQRVEAERLEQERLQKLENERLQKLEQEKVEAEKLKQERLQRVETERLQRLEQEKIEAERVERERLQRVETERLQRVEQEKIEAERIERKRLERVETERIETERLQRLETERVERERLQRLEQERIERLQVERIERERLQRIEAEKIEAERIERERLQRIESERIERQRVETERVERERLQRVETERIERQRVESERIERERLQRIESERIERERLQRIESERLQNSQKRVPSPRNNTPIILNGQEISRDAIPPILNSNLNNRNSSSNSIPLIPVPSPDNVMAHNRAKTRLNISPPAPTLPNTTGRVIELPRRNLTAKSPISSLIQANSNTVVQNVIPASTPSPISASPISPVPSRSILLSPVSTPSGFKQFLSPEFIVAKSPEISDGEDDLDLEEDDLDLEEDFEFERVERERLEQERVERERLEDERVERERLEQERVETERLEQQRVETERLEGERVERERLEQERVEKIEQERVERERLERLEAQRLESQRLEQQRLESQRLEQQRLESQRLEQQRLQAQQLEQQRLQAQRLEQQRLHSERLEAQRKAAETRKLAETKKPTKINRPDILSPENIPVSNPNPKPAPTRVTQAQPTRPPQRPTQTPSKNTPQKKIGAKNASGIMAPKRRANVEAPRKVFTSTRAMPDYESMSPEEAARWRADFNMKLGILREAYSHCDIPTFDHTIPLSVIHQHYERYVQQIHIDNSVGNYQVYLLILFAGIELFCVKVLGLDMGGYCLNQLVMMNKYQRLLVELGEKSSVSIGESWPVEARIVGLALFNALIFLVVKLIGSYFGAGLGSVLQNIVNAFLTRGDATEHIKKAQGIGSTPTTAPAEEYANGEVPAPPAAGGAGGFDIAGLINTFGGMLGGGGAKPAAKKADRRPLYRE